MRLTIKWGKEISHRYNPGVLNYYSTKCILLHNYKMSTTTIRHTMWLSCVINSIYYNSRSQNILQPTKLKIWFE